MRAASHGTSTTGKMTQGYDRARETRDKTTIHNKVARPYNTKESQKAGRAISALAACSGDFPAIASPDRLNNNCPTVSMIATIAGRIKLNKITACSLSGEGSAKDPSWHVAPSVRYSNHCNDLVNGSGQQGCCQNPKSQRLKRERGPKPELTAKIETAPPPRSLSALEQGFVGTHLPHSQGPNSRPFTAVRDARRDVDFVFNTMPRF